MRGFLDVGGNSMNAIASFDTFGQVGEPWLVLEGVSTTALLPSGGNGNYWDYLSVDEASAKTVGAGAEGQNPLRADERHRQVRRQSVSRRRRVQHRGQGAPEQQH